VADQLHVLVAGFLNSPHVTSWVAAVAAVGNKVELAGRDAPQLPPAGRGPGIYKLPATGPPLVRSLRMSRALGHVAADLEPDLVHAHWLSEFGWLAARERLRPLICSAWGSDVLRPGRLGRRRSLLALQRAALVLADSAHLARATRALAGRDVPIEVVRLGLDLERFSPGDPTAARRELGLPEEGLLIAGVRGLAPVYNPELLLEAFALVRQRHGDARLLLKHPGAALPARLKASIERLGLPEAVDVLGNLPAERLPAVYRAADVVVSIPTSDSSPRSVWEALACGRPVVVSDLPWARDELAPGGQALLAELDPRSISQAIARVLDDGDVAADLRTAARDLAVAELDQAACSARIDALYRSVIERTR
jgi:glycosyltransferase involved in cell wall biosynthesis